jgi:transcription elongation factor GreA-like protein
MGPLSIQEYTACLAQSDLYKKYKDSVDPKSAFEILSERMRDDQESQPRTTSASKVRPVATKSALEDVLTSPVAKQVGKELVRGVFGMLFGSAPRRRSPRRGW